MTPTKPWDCSCKATKVGLERMMRALVVVGGHFTSSFHLTGTAEVEKPSSVEIFLRVWIPEGQELKFERLAQTELEAPPVIQLN